MSYIHRGVGQAIRNPERRHSSHSWLARLGFGDGPGDVRLAWLCVLAALGIYLLVFAVYYPVAPTNTDEASYIQQARMLLEARTSVLRIEPLSGETAVVSAARYPLGTALSLAPFVWLAGWRAAFIVPCLSLVLGVLLTARWLHEAGRSPIFALLVLGFPPALVLGRVAMSDAPSLALVALGLWLFWRGLDRDWPTWFASACVAGLSVAFRESNLLPFAGFYAGAVLRREHKAWSLAAGVVVGGCVRLVSAYLVYDDPFFFRSTSATFGRHGVSAALSLQIVGLLIFVPGGLALALAYRGRRRPELLASVAVFAVFYLAFGYGALELGAAKRLVLGLRFYLPLLPLLAFAAAESAPRLWGGLCSAVSTRRRARLETFAAVALTTWIACVVAASGLMQWAQHRWTSGQAEMRQAIHALLGPNDVIVTNLHATSKFLPWYDSRFFPVNRGNLDAVSAARLARRWGEFTIVLLDRSESEYWRNDARANAAFIASLRPPPALQFDRQFGPTDRLRVWRVRDR